MKKYWKLISLLIVILLTFSIYYVHGALAKEELLELELVTVTDKADIEDDITIHGHYDDGTMYWNSFTLTSEGMKNESDLGYFERMNNFYPNPTLDRLRKEYRGFMRGKESVELLYEDEAVLAYVGPYSQYKEKKTFKVEQLDKATKDKQTFSVDLPPDAGLDYMTIMKVQAEENKIYVFTSNHYREGGQIHVYEIDADEEKIINDTVLVNDSGNSYITFLNDYRDISKTPYLVLSVVNYKWDEETGIEETISQEFISFHTATGEKQIIEPPEGWNASTDELYQESYYSEGNYIIKDEYLYFMSIVSDGLEVIPYHLDENKSETTVHIPIEQSIVESIRSVLLDGENLSIISTAEENGNVVRKLFIFDLPNEDILYEGDIKIKHTAKEMLVYELDLYNVFID